MVGGSLLLQFNHLNALNSTKASLQSSLQCQRKTCPGQYQDTKTPRNERWKLIFSKTKQLPSNTTFQLQTELQIKQCKSASWPENDCNKAQRARNERQHTAIQLQRLQIACCLRPSFQVFHLISCHSSTAPHPEDPSKKTLWRETKKPWCFHPACWNRSKMFGIACCSSVRKTATWEACRCCWATAVETQLPNFMNRSNGEHGFFIDEAVHTRQNSETQNKVFCRTLYYTKQV